MERHIGRPLTDADWKIELDFQFEGSLKVIRCKASPGKYLHYVKAGKRYAFTGQTLASLGGNCPPPFSVYEIEELDNSG